MSTVIASPDAPNRFDACEPATTPPAGPERTSCAPTLAAWSIGSMPPLAAMTNISPAKDCSRSATVSRDR